MADKKLYLGIDLGGTNIQAGVVNDKAEVIGRNKKKTKSELGAEGVMERIVKAADGAADDAGVKLKDIDALGIGAPGAIDYKKGLVYNAPNLRWRDFPLADELGKLVPCPVIVDNDVNVGTWGEFRAGGGKGGKFDEMLGVFVGTGIGAGLIIHGRLYHGSHLTAGEIGHTVLHADAPKGRRTLENCASRTASVNLLRELILANHESVIGKLVDGDLDGIKSKILAEAVENKDPLTLEVLQQSAHYVGVAVANVVTMLSLPAVVLGGGVVEALGKTYVKWCQASFEQHVFPAELKQCKMLVSTLGDDAGVIGAALLARDRTVEKM